MTPSYDQKQAAAVLRRCEVCKGERFYTDFDAPLCAACKAWARRLFQAHARPVDTILGAVQTYNRQESR